MSMAYRILLFLLNLAIGFNACGEYGAEPAPPAFKALRYEETYQALKDLKRRHGLGDDIKYIALPFLPDAYLSLGGEWRERYQNLHGYEFGLAEFKNDDYLLQRVLLHGDLHLGSHFRAFIQLGSHYAFGKANEKSPVEEDHFDLQQGFAEWQWPRGSHTLTIRSGRQEMSFGSERLVSMRNNPNIRRSFDAVRASFKGGGFTVDAFYAAPLELRQGVLDDRDDGGQRFWGLYSVFSRPAARYAPNTDFYCLGLDRADAVYAQGIADEHRHTLGARLWRKSGSWDYNFEFAYQFGRFGKDTISAWTAASDTGYRWEHAALKPRLGLKMDIISGDDNPHDRTLKTFNPLFPKLAYFSENALVVPANLMNVYPYISIEAGEGVELSLGWDFLWRYSVHDAFYVNPFQPLDGTDQSRGRYIGSELTLDAGWQVNRNIQLNFAYVHLFTGSVLRSVKANDVDFLMLMTSYRF
ncbi:alginate export family protein [Methylomicrobium album]|nr:alginate export family protein [Methylomicrobium album]